MCLSIILQWNQVVRRTAAPATYENMKQFSFYSNPTSTRTHANMVDDNSYWLVLAVSVFPIIFFASLFTVSAFCHAFVNHCVLMDHSHNSLILIVSQLLIFTVSEPFTSENYAYASVVSTNKYLLLMIHLYIATGFCVIFIQYAWNMLGGGETDARSTEWKLKKFLIYNTMYNSEQHPRIHNRYILFCHAFISSMKFPCNFQKAAQKKNILKTLKRAGKEFVVNFTWR